MQRRLTYANIVAFARAVHSTGRLVGTTGAAGTTCAYGLVRGTSVFRSKNITGVTSPAVGKFCVALAAGIDAASTGAVATPEFSTDSTSFLRRQ